MPVPLRLPAAWLVLATLAAAQPLVPVEHGRTVVAAVATASAAQDAAALTLVPGQPAPSLDGARWLHGEPLPAWQPGRVTVIAFWSPASPAGVASLVTLHGIVGRYEGRRVDVVAIAAQPAPGDPPLDAFVESRADVLHFRVAEDTHGLLARRLLEPAGLRQLPVVLLVDGSGRLAWTGPPDAELQRALQHVVSRNRARVLELEFADDVRALRAAAERRDWPQVEDISGRLYRVDRVTFGAQAATHYEALILSGRDEQARSWGRRMLTADFAGSAPGLNLLAWTIVKPGGALPAAKQDLDLALALAERADALTGNVDPYILDTLARVRFLRGDTREALRLQIRALEFSRGLTGRLGAEVRAELADRLEQYADAVQALAEGN